MMKVEFYGHVRQYTNIKSEIDRNMNEVLMSGQYVQGPMLKRFEAEFAAYSETKYAVGLGNGTDAIWLALMALGIGPGDEVITHPNTFFATAEAIWIAGATAVFVDCCPKTKCICPANIEAARRGFRVGNLYINRGCTGAIVERHPFGGFKLSGVGSKAGGPDYLLQFMVPRNVVENTMRRGFAPSDGREVSQG